MRFHLSRSKLVQTLLFLVLCALAGLLFWREKRGGAVNWKRRATVLDAVAEFRKPPPPPSSSFSSPSVSFVDKSSSTTSSPSNSDGHQMVKIHPAPSKKVALSPPTNDDALSKLTMNLPANPSALTNTPAGHSMKIPKTLELQKLLKPSATGIPALERANPSDSFSKPTAFQTPPENQVLDKLSPSPQFLYYSRHHATLANMKYVVDHFHLNMYSINPEFWQPYGINEETSRNLIDSNLIPLLCSSYPVIIVSDTIPDSRPFLLHDGCQATIILEITNRFDWDTYDEERDSFIQLLRTRAASKKSDGRPWVMFMANNPYDAFYLKRETGMWDLDVPIIRPMGVAPVPVDWEIANDPETVASVCAVHDDKMLEIFDRYNISVKIIPSYYGGPHTLAYYKANIIVPYQLSVMKMIENLIAGVKTLIPSQEFYKELAVEWDMYNTKDVVVKYSNWTEYIEDYHPDFKDYFYHFNSWEQLREIVNRDPLQTDFRVQHGQVAMLKMRAAGLEEWRRLFVRLGLLRPQ